MTHPLPYYNEVLRLLSRHKITAYKYLDLGCGSGTFTYEVAKHAEAKEVYGIDIDDEKLNHAPNPIKTLKLDLQHEKLPFPSKHFDLITAFEVIEHLAYSDNLVQESFRALREGGYFLITTPNLASWVNRLLVLLGYQPDFRTIEPSKYYLVGLPYAPKKYSSYVGHLSSYTLKALTSILSLYGFKTVDKMGVAYPYEYKIVSLLDKLFSKRSSLATDIIVLSQKPMHSKK